ncbi:MAG: hypothetical protein LBN39_01100 [Planctomycetaceae bacterium]|jgi:hypothetical protein|nr:hypothetical protein [Planctomycetaceae bacterium]
MSRRIVIFSNDPGGANTIIPLVAPLRQNGEDVLLFGKGPALKKYAAEGLTGTDLSQILPESTPENVADWVRNVKPDAVITGTSAVDPTEKYLWLAGERLGIVSLAVLDQWINYGIRFSPYTVYQLAEYQNDKRFPYLPSKICVMDEFAETEALADGLPKERLAVTGQPYFETVLKNAAKITPQDCIDYLEPLGIHGREIVAVFASEPLFQEQGEPGYLGFTERSALKMLAEAIQLLCGLSGTKATLIIRQHPREKPGNFDGIIPQIENENLRVVFENQSNPHLAMLSAHIVCGMSSMFLLEGALLGKPVLSVMPNLTGESPFVLDRLGMTKSITSGVDLNFAVDDIFRHGPNNAGRFCPVLNAAKNVLNTLESLL